MVKINPLKLTIALLILFAIWGACSLIFHQFCPVVLITGLPCPGCGLTRAFIAFFTMHPLEAFKYNPTYPLWIVLAAMFLWQVYVKRRITTKLRNFAIVVALVTIVAYILRMVFLFPSSEPLVYHPGNVFAHIYPEYSRLFE